MTNNAISEIWYTRCPVPTPVGLAAQLGYLEETFRKDGVPLKSIIDSPDRDVCQSYFDHTLDWSFRHGANLPPIRARSEGIVDFMRNRVERAGFSAFAE
ncbi:desulfurase [Agrobacterium rhizogenes]|nr:desulfurase [Rhizobium rhizogenes]